MGRAIVRDPAAFLMDEPLSNLDAKLRVQMRTEVSRIQQSLGTTTVYVTHDQTEAMTLGDRVAVMRGGALQQVASPKELYDDPVNLFVAGFIGSPAMNFFSAEAQNGKVLLPMGEVDLPQDLSGASGNLIAGIRPEDFEDADLVGDHRGSGFEFEAPIDQLESMGSEIYAYFTHGGESAKSDELSEIAADIGGGDLPSDTEGRAVARLDPASQVRKGEKATLWLDPARIHLFDPESGQSLRAREKAAA
jgi:multiple sugar transport system ATP-binding protein